MIDPAKIKVGGLYSRSNKVRRVVDIYDAYEPAFGKVIKFVRWEWVVGRLKYCKYSQKQNITWLTLLASWAEFEVEENRLPAYEEAISGN